MNRLHADFQLFCIFLGYLELLTGFDITYHSEVDKKSKG